MNSTIENIEKKVEEIEKKVEKEVAKDLKVAGGVAHAFILVGGGLALVAVVVLIARMALGH